MIIKFVCLPQFIIIIFIINHLHFFESWMICRINRIPIYFFLVEETVFFINNLFDEVEKAHINTIHLFLQILDGARMMEEACRVLADLTGLAAVVSRPAASGMVPASRRATRSTSFVTATRATPAHSWTVPSWRVTPTACWKA